MTKRRPYTKTEINLIRKLYPDQPTCQIAKRIGRPNHAVYNQAIKMGLKKSAAYMENEKKRQGEKLKTAGAKTRFSKGIEPPNKGKKMPSEIYARISQTMFRKGHVPHNAHTPDPNRNIIRKDKSGKHYIYVKLPGYRKATPKHTWLWQTHNGTIPRGYNIVFRDGNTMNCIIDNLECISNAELMKRNSLHRFPEEIKSTIRLITKLKKKIHAKEQN